MTEMTVKEVEARIGDLGAELGKVMKAYGLKGEFSIKIKVKDGHVVTSFGYREEDGEPGIVFSVDTDRGEGGFGSTGI